MKKLIYILSKLVLILLTFASCEDYYNPHLDSVPGLLVVESHFTNNLNQCYIKLTKSIDFYSSDQAGEIAGAKVELIERQGSSLTGIESSTGYFTFLSTPIPGNKYFLRITCGNDIYESDKVVMPPLPTIDTLYTENEIQKSYRTDDSGPTLVETPGRNICIDAPITSSLEYYRFNWRSVIEWGYAYPAPPIPQRILYGWKSRSQEGLFNLAGPKEFSVTDKVEQHPILFMNYNYLTYLDSATQIKRGYIIIIDQYGITKETYDFYDKLNQQFTAEGSLFDPVMTQVTGNIHCTTDPTKTVAGFFDLNSYRQYRYFMDFGSNEESAVIQRRINRKVDIPGNGFLVNIAPQFWENYN
jgi:hypothetical protein